MYYYGGYPISNGYNTSKEAIILVLFILLVIIIGSSIFNKCKH